MSKLLGGVISELVLILLNLDRHKISGGCALVDTKSHASKNSKVTMSKLLGGVISELVLILLNLDFEIDQS
jgi:hypothetical protein